MRPVAVLLLLALSFTALADDNNVTFKEADGRVSILIGGKDVATYVYDDPVVKRPYFCQVKTLSGISVTRPYPPDPVVNKDNDDHETMHPGLWLTFGDINGVDFWRNKGTVRHVEFPEPFIETVAGVFTVVNSYEPAEGGPAICEEVCTYKVVPIPNGYVIAASSEFSSEKEFYFGDQEEMGFGVRVNTPLTVEFGKGEIKNSEGGINEQGTWGKQAAWCAYSGVVEGRRLGICMMPDPGNFRPSWFHSRDYGLLVANPFGKKAMTAPDDKAVQPDKTPATGAELSFAPYNSTSTTKRKAYWFKLGFGAFIFDVPQDQQPDYNQAVKSYDRARAIKTHVN